MQLILNIYNHEFLNKRVKKTISFLLASEHLRKLVRSILQLSDRPYSAAARKSDDYVPKISLAESKNRISSKQKIKFLQFGNSFFYLVAYFIFFSYFFTKVYRK